MSFRLPLCSSVRLTLRVRVCVRARVCARACVYVCVCVRAWARACVSARVGACVASDVTWADSWGGGLIGTAASVKAETVGGKNFIHFRLLHPRPVSRSLS